MQDCCHSQVKTKPLYAETSRVYSDVDLCISLTWECKESKFTRMKIGEDKKSPCSSIARKKEAESVRGGGDITHVRKEQTCTRIREGYYFSSELTNKIPLRNEQLMQSARGQVKEYGNAVLHPQHLLARMWHHSCRLPLRSGTKSLRERNTEGF